MISNSSVSSNAVRPEFTSGPSPFAHGLVQREVAPQKLIASPPIYSPPNTDLSDTGTGNGGGGNCPSGNCSSGGSSASGGDTKSGGDMIGQIVMQAVQAALQAFTAAKG
jgi:hypothetical protein